MFGFRSCLVGRGDLNLERLAPHGIGTWYRPRECIEHTLRRFRDGVRTCQLVLRYPECRFRRRLGFGESSNRFFGRGDIPVEIVNTRELFRRMIYLFVG
jgi:hypothetical protein